MVHGRGGRVEAALRMGGNGASKAGRGIELIRRIRRCSRKADEKFSIIPNERVLQPLGVGERGEKAEEVAGQHRGLEHADESPVARQAAAYGKEWLRIQHGGIDLAIIGT